MAVALYLMLTHKHKCHIGCFRKITATKQIMLVVVQFNRKYVFSHAPSGISSRKYYTSLYIANKVFWIMQNMCSTYFIVSTAKSSPGDYC